MHYYARTSNATTNIAQQATHGSHYQQRITSNSEYSLQVGGFQNCIA
jgi:hypothetical protein